MHLIKSKTALKNWSGIQVFRFETGNRVINWFRSLLLVLIFVKMFEIQKWIYPVIIILYAVVVWIVGYMVDKKNLFYYFDVAYFDRGAISKKLDKMDK